MNEYTHFIELNTRAIHLPADTDFDLMSLLHAAQFKRLIATQDSSVPVDIPGCH